MFKALIVGCGSIGMRHLLEVTDYAEQIIIVDPSIEAHKKIEKMDIKNLEIFGNLTTALENHSKFDLVVISNWGPDHASVLEELVAINPGRILFEKPLASSLRDIDMIVTQLESRKIPGIVNFHLRFGPLYREISAIISSGEYGKITNISLSGGAKCIATNGIHYLDFVNHLFHSRPLEVMANLNNDYINPRNESLAFIGGVASWKYTENRNFTIDFSNSSYSDLVLIIYLERAKIIYENGIINLYTKGNKNLFSQIKITRTQVFNEKVREINLVSTENSLDGIHEIHKQLFKNPEKFKIRDYSESNVDLIHAFISSKKKRTIECDEIIDDELASLDWMIS